jgi:enterochelin esterase-like enzyme
MKKKYLTAIFIITTGILSAQTGKVLEGLTMESKILGYEVNFSVYLPPDYDHSERSYPVVYLLHGYSDDETAWVQFGEVNLAADRAIARREIPPMIIIMPDAKITWYINSADDKVRYEDMFFDEFIPFVENKYRIRKKREYRGISGLSMGGYGALIYSLHHPEIFAACAAFSSGVFTHEEIVNLDQNNYDNWFEVAFGTGTKGNKRLTAHLYKHSVLEQMKKVPEMKGKKVRYYLDCGDDDFLYKGNSQLHILMRDLKIPHEYIVRDGSHNWQYWRTGITNGLKFIGESFHR